MRPMWSGQRGRLSPFPRGYARGPCPAAPRQRLILLCCQAVVLAVRLSPHMVVMQNAAQKASRRLLRDFNEVEQLQVSVKGPSDFVSQADIRAEEILRQELTKARPGYGFLMEESGASGGDNWTWRWVIDPLDGTTNFLHGIPHWAISIALQRRLPDGTVELASGMVFSPASGEMFWAEKGTGAFVNERRLRVSARRDLTQSVFATGIPFAAVSEGHRLAFARTLGLLMPATAGVRRFGSAALDLAWVAAGRYEGYWELGLHPWDIAAGVLIVREAGGSVTDPAGAEFVVGDGQSNDVVAGNPYMQPKLRDMVAEGIAAAG
jgi:myo-inositol-1(or 4)-monophosphatase